MSTDSLGLTARRHGKFFIEQMEELKLRGVEFIKARLRWENWEEILPRLVLFADREISGRKWRGDSKGVLPEGADASSVAAEVVMKALQGKARLGPGWTLERLEKELRRMVSNEVRRLHKLKETGAMRSEWEVVKPGVNGEARSVLAWIPGGAGGTDLAELQAEDKARQMADSRIAERLEGEDVRRLFLCLRTRTVKRRDIASKLGMSATEVTNCRKRLNRQLKELGIPSWRVHGG